MYLIINTNLDTKILCLLKITFEIISIIVIIVKFQTGTEIKLIMITVH